MRYLGEEEKHAATIELERLREEMVCPSIHLLYAGV